MGEEWQADWWGERYRESAGESGMCGVGRVIGRVSQEQVSE